MTSITVRDARLLSFKTRDEAVDAVVELMTERDELVAALREVLATLGPDAFTNAVVRAQQAIARAEGRA